MLFGKNKAVSPLVMWAIILAGFFLINVLLPASTYLYEISPLRYLILPAVAYFLFFFISAFKEHKQAIMSAASIDRIVKTGVYRYVRHPIYSADIMLGIGIFFYAPTIRIMAAVACMIVILILWMGLEESALIEKFGNEYREYKNEVPMFIPWLKH